MARNDYVLAVEQEFAQQLKSFKLGIPQYAEVLGVTPEEVAQQAADADRYDWELRVADICLAQSQAWTKWKRFSRMGGKASVAAPVIVSWPSPEPSPVPPGIEKRFRRLVQRISSSAAFNASIAAGLGVAMVKKSGPDSATLQPVLKLHMDGGAVVVSWSWLGFSRFLDLIEIHVDRGDGKGMQLLNISVKSRFIDPQPLPQEPIRWTYQACFRVGDARFGQWSNAASIVVAA